MLAFDSRVAVVYGSLLIRMIFQAIKFLPALLLVLSVLDHCAAREPNLVHTLKALSTLVAK